MAFDPLHNPDEMVALIQRVTGEPRETVAARLEAERADGGVSVREAFATSGGTRYVYDEAMERFYEETDAFVYELAVWNANGFKKQMGRWITRWLAEHLPGTRRVLSIGDGLGFETLRLARKGQDVTYFEVPGVTARFAREMLRNSGVAVVEPGADGEAVEPHRLGQGTPSDPLARATSPAGEGEGFVPVAGRVTFLTDADAISRGGFDALVCLDVLEHVPDPAGFVKSTLLPYLKPGGVLFVHAPFYMIHPSYPTHVRASRRHSGSMRLYRDAGLRLLDGQAMWNPLVWQAPGGEALRGSAGGRAFARMTRPYLALGRWAMWPFLPVHWAKFLKQGGGAHAG